MKKIIVPAMLVLSTFGLAAHAADQKTNTMHKPMHHKAEAMRQDGKDMRSANAKSQDMYVAPTLKMTVTTVPVTAEQAKANNLKVQEVPAGTVPPQGAVQSAVFNAEGQQIPAK